MNSEQYEQWFDNIKMDDLDITKWFLHNVGVGGWGFNLRSGEQWAVYRASFGSIRIVVRDPAYITLFLLSIK